MPWLEIAKVFFLFIAVWFSGVVFIGGFALATGKVRGIPWPTFVIWAAGLTGFIYLQWMM